ncbi:MAG: molybdopterin adenylyltransferase [Betaproteobacteria bacterium]|nr:molybdopterin adenylyltransferase [Candidatus Fonsibacter lacus]
MDDLHFGLLSVSDRAAAGTYEDQGLPALQQWLQRAIRNPLRLTTEVIPDERPTIAHALRTMADGGCHVVLTTGGTGPAPRDVTPEATMDVSDRVRQIGLQFVPTAILSRQVAVMRGKCLIINLPGQPKSIAETLEGVRDADGQIKVPGIFTAVPYCVDLMGGPYIETNAAVCDAFRPKSARRPSGG